MITWKVQLGHNGLWLWADTLGAALEDRRRLLKDNPGRLIMVYPYPAFLRRFMYYRYFTPASKKTCQGLFSTILATN